ncbi:PREDICTED: F-box/FBD/LRR-repeat protein At1g13570-like isoform X1 [Prunus mume]|uniref:F-box/FBD/LRR-repeat protein At1g13570-like isoform X1 n=1 Tax=Prunus mume TaxID=102107 RepID=A0ABM0P9G6_PRUMU|nr:PREDICTED: F-box/FBD/LRR-repeat protein At1g13570-like isoform X1 [Prunus mume]
MEQREPPKSRSKSESELDRISNLPSDVLEQILSHLPIREVARTSVLSSKWRYRTAMIRHLVFDKQCVSTKKRITFVDIVDHVLLGHIGPIHKFKLSHLDRLATWDIDRWILHLSRNSIKEFVLEIEEVCCYSIPSYLFSCEDMIHLELFSCLIKPPPTFKGFRNLKSLVFQRVTLAQDAFQNLIACCPLLERLTLREFNFTHLKIDAPNLKFLDVEGDFEDVIFQNTLNLADVCICTDTSVGQRWACDSTHSMLVKFLVHLPHIQRLKIQGFFLQILALGALSAELPKPCLYLNFLSISVNFNDLREILTALCLLRSTPAVRELEISAAGSAFQEISADREGHSALSEVNSLYGNWIFPFSQLRFVKMSDVSDVKAELDFIRFLLLNSPVLEKIIVKPAYADDSWELVKQLLRLGRASVHSEIIFLDP